MWPTLETVIDICSIEPKAVFFATFDGEQTIVEATRSFNDKFPGLELTKSNVYSYLKKGLAHVNPPVIESTASGQGTVYSLTVDGEAIQDIVAFVAAFLPNKYNISFSEVGNLFGRASGKNSHSKVKIFQHLIDNPNASLESFSNFGQNIYVWEKRLDDLMTVKDCEGNYVPLVELTTWGNRNNKIYVGTGKKVQADDLRPIKAGSTVQRVANIFNNNQNAFQMADLVRIIRKSPATIYLALKALGRRGYVTSQLVSEFKRYTLTETGRDYVQNCLVPATKALEGDLTSLQLITRNHPNDRELTHAINVYHQYTPRK